MRKALLYIIVTHFVSVLGGEGQRDPAARISGAREGFFWKEESMEMWHMKL